MLAAGAPSLSPGPGIGPSTLASEHNFMSLPPGSDQPVPGPSMLGGADNAGAVDELEGYAPAPRHF